MCIRDSDRRDVVERAIFVERRFDRLAQRLVLERETQNSKTVDRRNREGRDRAWYGPSLTRLLVHFHRLSPLWFVTPLDLRLPRSVTRAASRRHRYLSLIHISEPTRQAE